MPASVTIADTAELRPPDPRAKTGMSARPSETDSATSDETLAVRAAADPTCFEILYRRYVDRIYRFAYSQVGERQDAEDVTAAVFLSALESLPRYRSNHRFSAWLFTIARRRTIDHMRKKRPDPVDGSQLVALVGADRSADRQLVGSERLAEAVARLPDDKRRLLALRYAADLSFVEMADVLGKSEPAVKMAFYRVLQQLREETVQHDE